MGNDEKQFRGMSAPLDADTIAKSSRAPDVV